MHAILLTAGTDDDVFPYVGLGARLRSRGHRGTLLSNEHYGRLAAEHGFGFDALYSEEETQALLSNPDLFHPTRSATLGARWGVRSLDRQYAQLAGLARAGDTLLVAAAAVFVARPAPEKLSPPPATIILQPWVIKSINAPPVMPHSPTLPRRVPRHVGRLYWRLIDAVGDFLVGSDLNRMRAALSLKPMRRVFEWWLSPQLVIGLFPDWFGQPQADWPPQLKRAGFPLYDGRPRGSLPPEVLEFCRAGKPPVVFPFGTGMQHGARLFGWCLEACRLLGVRGLFLTKYRQQLPDPFPAFARHCHYAPFGELFRHCAAVVHHGGVGTNAPGLVVRSPHPHLPPALRPVHH